MKARKALALIAAAISLTMTAAPINIYVSSTSGSDSAAGSATAPLRSVAEALKRAREMRRLHRPGVEEGIEILLSDGVHRLSRPLFVRPEDSGTPTGPTVIKSVPGARAAISGGVSVTGWTRPDRIEGVADSLQGKIWVASAPMDANRIVETRQLYINGNKAVRATQFAPGEMARMVDFNIVDRSITVPAPKADLSHAKNLEMLVHQRWAIAILRVKELTKLPDGNLCVTFHDPESSLEFSHPWPQPVIGGEKGNSSFAFTNALQLLDSPGEWYQDYPSGRFYLYPPAGVDPSRADITVPVLETLVQVEGAKERTVSNVTFNDIDFEYSAWTRPSREGHVTLQGGFRLLDAYKLAEPGLPEKAELENQAWIARPEAAVTVSNACGIDLRGCTFRNLGATGLDYESGVASSTVDNCLFEEIGGTAIQIGTFPAGGFETHVPYRPADPSTLCTGITVSNSRIIRATGEDWGCVGIGAGYVSDLTIADNEVSHLNYSGICVGWGWTPLESGMKRNRILRNHVHHYAAQLYDAGGIYTLSNQPGSEIKGNRIEAPLVAPYATNDRAFSIYFDEATDGYTVEGNICPPTDFGYNRPGPNLRVKNNGPKVKPSR